MNDEKMKQQLIVHEGVRLSAYQDSLGFWTIGVGRLIDIDKGGRISWSEAMVLLENDIVRVGNELDAAIPWWRGLDEVRQRVLVDMAFNLGTAGLLTFKNTIQAVKEHRYFDAAAGMLASKWASQVGERAANLAAMMKTGLD